MVERASKVFEIETEYELLVQQAQNIKTVNGNSLLGSGNIVIPVLVDGDKGDITVSADGTSWVIDTGAIGTSKLGGDISALAIAFLLLLTPAAQREALGLDGDSYAPTSSNKVNLDALPTMLTARYVQTGSIVTVSGSFTANPTLTATPTSFEISLPWAVDITTAAQVSGVATAGGIAGMSAAITGSAANNTAVVNWIATDITNQNWGFNFNYSI